MMRGPTAVMVGLALLASPAAAACAVDPYQFSPYPESLVLDQSGAQPARAWFHEASTIYDHFVLGREHEPTLLYLQHLPGRDDSICATGMMAGDGYVFEDIAPRLADLTGDGWNEVIVVRSNVMTGAQLTVYGVVKGTFRLIAETAPLGRHRWLAPAGIADFDGDGRTEIAYVDRPHLLAELVLVRLEGDRLVETLRLPGLTNHRIGDAFISGGVRDCGQGAELVLASKDWTRVMRVLNGQVNDLGPMPAAGLTVPPC